MQSWLKKNLTISVLFTLLAGYGVGASYAAVLHADVARLKSQVDGLPERLGRLEQKTDDIKEGINRVEKILYKG